MIGTPGATTLSGTTSKETKGRGQVRFAHGLVIALLWDHWSGGHTSCGLRHQNDPMIFMECTPSGRIEATLANSLFLVKRFSRAGLPPCTSLSVAADRGSGKDVLLAAQALAQRVIPHSGIRSSRRG
jgi:hypothetical protein